MKEREPVREVCKGFEKTINPNSRIRGLEFRF